MNQSGETRKSKLKQHNLLVTLHSAVINYPLYNFGYCKCVVHSDAYTLFLGCLFLQLTTVGYCVHRITAVDVIVMFTVDDLDATLTVVPRSR